MLIGPLTRVGLPETGRQRAPGVIELDSQRDVIEFWLKESLFAALAYRSTTTRREFLHFGAAQSPVAIHLQQVPTFVQKAAATMRSKNRRYNRQ
jgi:hypothetical protein